MKSYRAVLWGAAVVCGVTACGMKPEKHYQTMRANLIARNFAAANEHLEKSKSKVYSKDNRLLFYMDKGMVLHLGKQYKASNQFLEQAKSTAEELWTESVGKNAAAWLTTDNSLPYQGEDFEKVLTHFVAALNFIGLGDYSGARVEARQITNKLELYTSKYEERANIYKDDAFARWLSGKLAATAVGADTQALNDAWIDYQKAISVYETDYAARYRLATPRFVVADALRALEALGPDFQEEFGRLRSRYPAVTFKKRSETQSLGEVVFIHMSGEAPFKVDQFWDARAGRDHIRVAFPKFVAKRNLITRSRVSIAGQSSVAELAEPVTAIAIKNLDDHMGRIKAKAIARAVAKFIASKTARAVGKKKGGTAGTLLQLGGAAFQAASNIAEEADKRSWITLPSVVNVASAFVPPGKQQLKVALLNSRGGVVGTVTLPVEVKAGQVSFVSYRTFR